jgi:NADPH:quinone reductase-like Zn-dependent oxidoreductase
MKAIIYEQYGAPEVLRLKEMETPAPGDSEVLVRIYATSVTSGDVRLRKADPFAVRFMFGLFRPKNPILGVVFAGEIEAAGKEVQQFKEGDLVYGTTGMNFGAYAEYICVGEKAVLVVKPTTLNFKEAASIPFGATTALHFLRKAKTKKGQKVLIYGASGAVGTAAVQIAKYFGAEVTAVCSTTNVSLVKALGADRVIDYKKDDFSKGLETYDIIFDAVGKSPFSGCIKSLNSKGSYLRVVHMSPAAIVKGLLVNMTSSKKVIGGGITETQDDLLFLNHLIEGGHLKPVIDRTYTLDQMVEAHSYVEQGHKKGNVVVTI